MAVCPNCGSHNFRYELRAAGTRSTINYYRTGVKNSWILPAGQKTYQSQRKQKAVGICPDCGYVEERQEKGCLFYLLCLLFFPISLSVWFYKTKAFQLDKKWRALIIACFWVLLIVLLEITPSPNVTRNDEVNASTSIWNAQYAELTDFDYYIDGHSIVLKSYKGRASRVRIAPSYNVDGEAMPVVELDGTFALKSIESVIVPESVTRIVSNTFNSCGVKNLYLPASLVDFTGWNYFHDVQKLYYGGTEEQWAALFTGERSRLDVVQIVCDTDPNTLLTE